MALNPRDSLQRSELELFTRKALIAVLLAAIVALLWAARDAVVLVFLAAVLAAGIAPAVYRVRVRGRQLLHRSIPRATAVLIVYLPFLVVALLLLVLIIPRVVVDLRALSSQLPLLIERNILRPLEPYVPVDRVRAWFHGGFALHGSSVVFYLRSAVTAVASFAAVLFMVGYMLVDAPRLRNLILLAYPPEVRAERRATLRRIGNRMSSWLSGQILLSAIIGTATFAGLLALRIPYALPLALFAAVGETVPVIGPIVGTAPALAVALLQSRWQFWSVLALAIVLQKAENLFIAPRVMSRKVAISPLAVFIAFMIGATLLGIVGVIIAVPAAVVLQVAFEEIFVSRRERRHDASRAGTLTKPRG